MLLKSELKTEEHFIKKIIILDLDNIDLIDLQQLQKLKLVQVKEENYTKQVLMLLGLVHMTLNLNLTKVEELQ